MHIPGVPLHIFQLDPMWYLPIGHIRASLSSVATVLHTIILHLKFNSSEYLDSWYFYVWYRNEWTIQIFTFTWTHIGLLESTSKENYQHLHKKHHQFFPYIYYWINVNLISVKYGWIDRSQMWAHGCWLNWGIDWASTWSNSCFSQVITRKSEVFFYPLVESVQFYKEKKQNKQTNISTI